MTERFSKMPIAEEAYGDVPDWVVELIRACEAPGSSQNKVAKKLGYTGPVVSQIIRNAYAGRTDFVEQAVRDVLMPTDIECPALGTIETDICLTHRRRASERLTSANIKRVQMFRACRACPRYQKLEEIE